MIPVSLSGYSSGCTQNVSRRRARCVLPLARPPAGDTTRRGFVVHCGLQPWLAFLSLISLQKYIKIICIKCYSVCACVPMDACVCVCKHMNATTCVHVEVRQPSGVSACLPPHESGLLLLLPVCYVLQQVSCVFLPSCRQTVGITNVSPLSWPLLGFWGLNSGCQAYVNSAEPSL